MWGVGLPIWRVAGAPNPSVGSQSLANPMGFTGTQPFDSLDAEESRNQKRGAERVGSGNCCGVLTTLSQARTCTSTMWPASSRCVSDSGGKRSGCRSAAHSTWVTPATGLRFWRLWRLLICMRMAMPPNTRAGLGWSSQCSSSRAARNPEPLLGVGRREFGQPERRRAG